MRRVVSSNSLISDVYQIISVTGSKLDDIPCIALAISPSKSSLDYNVHGFPENVIDDIKSCVSPPDPSSIIQIKVKNIPMRHFEVMMRRRRRALLVAPLCLE
jgi:hypothetical protein